MTIALRLESNKLNTGSEMDEDPSQAVIKDNLRDGTVCVNEQDHYVTYCLPSLSDGICVTELCPKQWDKEAKDSNYVLTTGKVSNLSPVK